MSGQHGWRVALTQQAETDFDGIIGWTTDSFGAARARAYAALLRSALDDLRTGPHHPLARTFDSGRRMGLLHIGRRRRPGRHFLLFQTHPDEQRILVLRILHNAMDLPRHVPNDEPP